MSTKAKFTDYKHAGCIVWTAVCVQCTCTLCLYTVSYVSPLLTILSGGPISFLSLCVCVDSVTLLHSSSFSISSRFPSLFHLSFSSLSSQHTRLSSPLPLSFFSLFSSLLSSSPLPGPCLAPSLQYVFSDK